MEHHTHPRRPRPSTIRRWARPTLRRYRSIIVGLGLVTAFTVPAIHLSGPGSAEGEPESRADFVVAGDGSVPTTSPKLRASRDPLSTDETAYAFHVATSDPRLPADVTDVNGERGPQVLSAEVPDDDVDATERRALVVLYDYTHDATHSQLVDLRAGSVVESTSATQVQPPPSPDETAAAIDLAIRTPDRLAFVDGFEAAEGVPLISPDQVTYVAGSWTYDGTTSAGRECGHHRCVRLLVQTPSGIFLDTTDFVVDLSDRSIVDLRP